MFRTVRKRGVFFIHSLVFVVVTVVVVVDEGEEGTLPPSVVINGHSTISRFPFFPCWGSPRRTRPAPVTGDPGYRDQVRAAQNLMSFTDKEMEEEEAHFALVVAAFRNYTPHSVKPGAIGRTSPLTFGSSRSLRTTGEGKISFVFRRKIKMFSKESDTRPG